MNKDIFERKRARALALMAEKKIWGSHAAPPLHRLLWKMKINLPPPAFSAFWLNVVVFGAMYTLTLPLLLLFPSPTVARFGVTPVIINLIAGLFFGLAMARFNYRRKKVHRLPDWDQL
ncbi:hypothetical protein FD733_04710 [Pantoea sp. Eser]|nr:hypothetical protein [Pantoea sp. Eser]